MKTLILLTFLTALTITFYAPSYKVNALDYYIEGSAECYASKSQSNNCKKIYCEIDNIEKNWPENTGYYEDCSKYENQDFRYVIASLLAVVGVVGTVLIVRRLSKNKKTK